jgi:hypothetical protein
VNAYGRSVGRANRGPAPAIYELALNRDLQEWYLSVVSDDDVRQFYHTMLDGSEAEKSAAVDTACETALAAGALLSPEN